MKFLLLVILFYTFSLSAQIDSNRFRVKVDSLFESFISDDSPGAVVLVQKDDNTVLIKGYGMANLEYSIPIQCHTVFDIASLSKQFCGFAIARLIEDGAISYFDDVRKFIPEIPDFGHTITISNLIHHTSGIRDWYSTLSLAGWRMDDVITFQHIKNMAFNQESINFSPGSEYEYSNTNYNLLVEVIQRVSGLSFNEWTSREIFEPLEMYHSHFRSDHNEVIPNKAIGYFRKRDQTFARDINGLVAPGSSSLFTTMEDLRKWTKAMTNGPVQFKTTFDLMQQRGVLKNGDTIPYAYGLVHGEYHGRETLGHGGSWASFKTHFVHFPTQGVSVIVLMNFDEANPGRRAYQVADIYFQEGNVKSKPQARRPSTLLPHKDSHQSSSLANYIGVYQLGPAYYVQIDVQGKELFTTATNEDSYPMQFINDSTFWVPAYNSSIAFGRDSMGEVTHFKYRGKEYPLVDHSVDLNEGELEQYIGHYWSRELQTTYEITMQDSNLVANHFKLGAIAISRAWKDDFRASWGFMRSVKFTRDEQGSIDGFLAGNRRSRNQRFVKIARL